MLLERVILPSKAVAGRRLIVHYVSRHIIFHDLIPTNKSKGKSINEKWREIQKGSERKGEALAIFYRLHIHPDLWRGIQEFLDTLSVEDREPFVFPEVEFLELTVNCDYFSRRLADLADRRSVAGAQILIGLAARRLHSMKFHAVAQRLKLTLSIRHCASGWQKFSPSASRLSYRLNGDN